jgi:tRNA pseudouridine55 synthase
MDGLILVDKPGGITSHDMVSRVRKLLKEKKVGHFGTLDPLATGLMLVAVGKVTKLFPFFLLYTKIYEGCIRLGISTDTYDSEGKFTSKESKNYPDKKNLLVRMKRFEGEIDQVSPPFSAKKYKGKPLYELTRQRKSCELKINRVTVDYFKLKKYTPPHLDFAVKCSSGTYIRSLANDLGASLDCGAHLTCLRRTHIGYFSLTKSYTLDGIKRLHGQGKTEKFLLPIETLLPEFPAITIKENAVSIITNGNDVSSGSFIKSEPPSSAGLEMGGIEENVFRIQDTRGSLLALGKMNPEKNALHPFLVLQPKVHSADNR